MKKVFKYIAGIFSFILFAGSLSLNVSNLDIKENINIALADEDTTQPPPPEPIDPNPENLINQDPISCSCPFGNTGVDCMAPGDGCVPMPCGIC